MVTLPILSFSQIPRHVPSPVVVVIASHRWEKILVISSIHVAGDSDSFEIVLRQRVRLAFSLDLESAGNRIPARMSIMAITNKSSVGLM